MKLDMKEIQDLIDLFIGSELGEMEVESHGTRLLLRRSADNKCDPVIISASPVGGDMPPVKQSNITSPSANKYDDAPEEASDGTVIKAPIAGVFYRSPAPGEKPFVSEGDKVSKGDIIGLMEAMKLMNEVVASKDGIVTEIIAENAKFCEYNEPIIRMADI